MGSSPTRGSSFFLGKVTALGVLCCFALFVCLFDLASFFLPSHLSLKTCTYILGVGQNVIIIRIIIHLYHIIIFKKVREHDLNLGQCTGKHHRLHDIIGF